jgi:imidazoleglycerol-phosphate dehydratase
MERKSEIKRKTTETDITLRVILDSTQESAIDSGVPFFDHMLMLLSRHGHLYLDLVCIGDTTVDDHHSVEDIGICLGRAFKKAIGDKAGIVRFGDAIIPMDDALTMVALDLSGRSFFHLGGVELKGSIKGYSEELTIEFLRSFAFNAELNLHVKIFYGENRHHIHESIFKALGVALYRAFSIDKKRADEIPSTKGTIV